MSCERCDQWLQELFDGAEPDAVLIEHLVACPNCRSLYESAVGLRRSLADLPRPQPPRELTDRLISAVILDRRKRQRQRGIIAKVAALAAGILVVLFVVEQNPRSERKLEPASGIVASSETPSLRKTLTEAGSAVVENARRQVSDVVASTLQLVPSVEGPMLPTLDAPSQLEPTFRPLKEAGQGVTVGLEPVTGSARRAFALFVRDLSPAAKPGS